MYHFGKGVLRLVQGGYSAIGSFDELKPNLDPASSLKPKKTEAHKKQDVFLVPLFANRKRI